MFVAMNGGRSSGCGGMQFPQPRDEKLQSRGSQQNGRAAPHRVRFPDEGEEDTGPLDQIAGVITGLLACVCLGGLSTILVVLYVTVRPFSLSAYRRLAAQLGAASFLDAVALLLPNTRICLTGDSDVPSPVGTSILVSNHVVEGDWWAMMMLGRCVGLRGSLKVFLRNEYLNVNVQNGESTRLSTTLTTSNSSITLSHRNENGTSGSPSGSSTPPRHTAASPDLSIMAKLLHLFLEFPLLNGDESVSEREYLFQLLRSFAENSGAAAPVNLLLFPEGWSLHNGADRLSIHAKSNIFAQREGRPQLKHLLLPRTRGFNALLESLRESNPVVYDVTVAYSSYDGSLPLMAKLDMPSLWNLLRRKFPREVHIRIKRYSMEEVLQDSSWLDKKWAEKDRLLSHFARHQSFPSDSRGYCRHRVFDTRQHSLESSTVALVRLLLLPCAVPVLLLLSIPLFWTLLWAWLAHRAFRSVFPDPEASSSSHSRNGSSADEPSQTPGSASASGTPFFPATPFVSPSVTNWRT